MNSRPSVFVLVLRYFLTVFTLTFLISIFWNAMSGSNMFPIHVAFWVAVVLTAIFICVGWLTVTVGSHVILRDDPEFQEWKAKGGRPYWDSLKWPINTTSPENRDND